MKAKLLGYIKGSASLGGKYFNLFKEQYREFKYLDIHKWFSENLVFFRSEAKGNNGILLTQMVKEYAYLLKIAAASKVLSEKNDLKVELYDVNIYWTWKQRKAHQLFKIFGNSVIEKMCMAFSSKPVFHCDDLYSDQKFIKEKLDEITKYLNDTPSAILTLQLDGIPVGDLIYDTYLRFFHKPTIKEIDEDVLQTIEKTLNIFYNFKAFLKFNDVKILVNTLSTYIHHGITTRICLYKGIPVYTLATNIYILQELTIEYPFHQKNHTLFDPLKKLAKDQIEMAKAALELPLSGENDAATSYMRQSAYFMKEITDELKNQFNINPRNVIIYMHDFYDSPHINRSLQFPDLYQFLKEVLDELSNLTSTSVFVKIHPNGIMGTREEAIGLVSSYNVSHFHILDEAISNLNIVQLKPDLICTARGSIGIEMAYFGIPVVAIYDNIYANFNFVDTCLTKERYFSVLKGEEDPVIDPDKNKIYSFYYQAYLEDNVTEKNSAFYNSKLFPGDYYSDGYLHFLKETISNTAYKENTIKCLSDFIG